ncbi:hypothetical protein [Synechococcus elongatus]|uniref:Uncharacterized protein n=1 Tax=Synechococcus elongatus PCC 11802 TaxID=2283154 RepID=A0AAT9JZI7_SYNEL
MLLRPLPERFLRSLAVAGTLGFVAPLAVMGLLWLVMASLSWLPGIGSWGQAGLQVLRYFCDTFGSGNPLYGLLVIGSTCAVVGMMFDTYAVSVSRASR